MLKQLSTPEIPDVKPLTHVDITSVLVRYNPDGKAFAFYTEVKGRIDNDIFVSDSSTIREVSEESLDIPKTSTIEDIITIIDQKKTEKFAEEEDRKARVLLAEQKRKEAADIENGVVELPLVQLRLK